MSEPTAVSHLENHAGYWLRFVSNHVSYAFKSKIESQGVTVAEWDLLRELFPQKELNPSELATHLGMTRGAISKLVERVVQKQLVLRSTSASDRRYQTLSLTAAGRKLVPRLAQLADENDREFFGHLSPEQRTALLNLLRDIIVRQGWKDVPVD